MNVRTDGPTVEQFDRLLDDQGVVNCLMALAQALRRVNDRPRSAPPPLDDKHRGYVREYLANQLMGLAAFWRVHLPESDRR